ncbi:MAG: Crp/Fnr family transcriptional regulator [Gemmatimonadaceae bacterium]
MQTRPQQPRRHGEASSAERNSLLLSLPPEEYEKVIVRATTVPLKVREDLITAGEPVRYVYFPQSGLLSIVNDMKADDMSIEVGVIGREGMAGLSLFHGSDTQPMRVLVQVAGEAKRISAADFIELLEGEMPQLKANIHLFTLAVLNQASQQAACNRLHSLEERCAKWLLTTHDNMESPELPLTQEFLAVMLGVRRPGVTVAAQTLQLAGLIRYKRGRINITDRRGLEELSCECYRRIREDYERLLGDFMIPAAGLRAVVARTA